MSSIVTNNYRYKRPPRKKRKAPGADQLPTIITIDPKTRRNVNRPKAPAPANEERESAIVIARKASTRFGDVLDMTPEESMRRADAADALFREIVRRASR